MAAGKTYSRRNILAGAAMAAGVVAASAGRAGGAFAETATRSSGPEALIIGSGYAGAVAALRLAQAGIRSLVIERGRRWPVSAAGNTFATPAAPDGRAAWLSTTSPFSPVPLDVYTGVLEAYDATGIQAMAGAGVGGGSLVNTTVMMQPSSTLFGGAFGGQLSYSEMASVWYPRARALIGPSPIPDDVLNSTYYAAARSWRDDAARANLAPGRVDMALDWDTVRQEIAGTTVPSAILGQSIWGMNSGAKRSVDRTILAAAEATGLAAVATLTRVTDIRPDSGGYLVTCERIDEHGTVLSLVQYRARYVFLAAGSLGTTRLLVKARATGSLPRLAPAVGTAWSTNGDHVAIRIGMPFNNPSQGGPSAFAVKDWTNPYGPVTLLSFPTRGPTATDGALGTLGVTLPPALGTFAYNSATGSVDLTWPATDPAVQRTDQAMADVIGRLNTANTTSTMAANALKTSHAIGGVPMGTACKQSGNVVGYDNLWVIDSSLLPGSMGAVPPALTVTALADRCVSAAAQCIAADRQALVSGAVR